MGEKAPSILLVTNPAAGNGTGTASARAAMREIENAIASGHTSSFFKNAKVDAAFFSSPEEASSIIEGSSDKQAVLSVGGDGLAHLTVNALMKIPADQRPAFGIIPAGTGNDYARALGLPLDVRRSVRTILNAPLCPVDVGLCNGVYFAETLSFGLDAAIALETVERRARTGRSDPGVYFSSGIDQLRHHLVPYTYSGTFDDREVEGQCITFAVQIGPYYGGGFKISPDASLEDGHLDICISHPPVGILRAIYVFIRAKNGKHVRMKPIELDKARHAVLDFTEEPPCQIDGEPMHATHFDITCVKDALRVFVGRMP